MEIPDCLLTDPHIEEIIPGEDWPRVSIRQAVFARSIEKTVDTMYSFLELPYIVDTFSTHRERRKWRSCLCAETYSFLQRNALRNAGITAIRNSILRLTTNYTGSQQEEIQRASEVFFKETGEIPEKNTVPEIQVIKQKAYEFLKLLETYSNR